MKQFKIYELTRKEFKCNIEYLGQDEQDEPIIKKTYFHTSIETKLLGKNPQELLRFNNIPQWEAKITGEFTAVSGHSNKGTYRTDFNGNPVTLLH